MDQFVGKYIFTETGKLDVEATVAAARKAIEQEAGRMNQDLDSVEAEVIGLLLKMPKVTNLTFDTLHAAIWENRNDEQKGTHEDLQTQTELRKSNRERLADVLRTLVNNSDWIYTGKGRNGVQFHYIPGEGLVQGPDGKFTGKQAVRTSDEEWSKLMLRKEEAAAKRAADEAKKNAEEAKKNGNGEKQAA